MTDRASLTLFLCGDVMTGRGVDQLLMHPGDPRLYERGATSALAYVALAEQTNGPFPRRVEPSYIWGEALAALDSIAPDARVINFETSVTAGGTPAPKGVNYRMDPRNVGVLTAAGIDCCVLANNHVLDWGEHGLLDTLDALQRVGVAVAGAGRDLGRARAPAIIDRGARGRLLVFAAGVDDSGIPPAWAASEDAPGVHLLPDLSSRTLDSITALVGAHKESRDVAVLSVHWGGNWGYPIPRAHRRFAHALIDHASIDVVHGHSSHHAKAMEVYRGKLILYGCGDFLNDYEGIGGYESYRGDLPVMYLPEVQVPDGRLIALRLLPFRIRRMTLGRPSPDEREWLRARLDREARRFGSRVVDDGDGYRLMWEGELTP